MSGVKPTPTKLSGLFDSSSSESSRQASPKPRLQPLSSPMKTPLREDVYLSPSIPNSPLVKIAKKGGSFFKELMAKTFILSFFIIFFFLTVLLSISNYQEYQKFMQTKNEKCTGKDYIELCQPAVDLALKNITYACVINSKVNIDDVVNCCENFAVHDSILIYKLSAKTEFIVAAIITLVNLIFIMISIYARLA